MSVISSIKTAFADSSKRKVLLVPIYGAIVESTNSSLSKSFNAFDLIQKLYDITNKQTYDGVILRINSPGGAASASEEIAKAILQLRKKHIPVVTSIGDLCASGAYLIASATEKIFANKMSLVGSIGAIMQIPNFSGLSEKLGIKLITSSSGKMKDIGNPSREITDEEKQYLDELVKIAAGQFIDIVQENRYINNPEEIFDGRIVNTPEALGHNLIDQIGTYNDAVQYMCKKLDVPQSRLSIRKYSAKSSIASKLLNYCMPFQLTSIGFERGII